MAKLEFKKLSVEETSKLPPIRRKGSTKYIEIVDACKTLLTEESIQINIPIEIAPEHLRAILRAVLIRYVSEYKFVTRIFGGTLIIKRIG